MPSGTASVPAYTPLNITGTQTLAQQAAGQDIAGSLALEQQYAPQLYNATQAYQAQVGSNIGQIQPLQNYVNQAANTVSGNTQFTPTPLNLPTLAGNPVQGATNALVGSNLQNPAQLPQDASNQILQQSAQTAGSSGTIGSLGAQGAAAANIGQASLNLQNENLQAGNTVGQQQQQLLLAQQAMQQQIAQFNQQLQQANLQQQAGSTGVLSSLTGPLNQSLTAVGNTPLPTSGLSPSDVGSLAVSNNNAQNQANINNAGLQQQAQNNMWNFYGGIAQAAEGLAAKAAMAAL